MSDGNDPIRSRDIPSAISALTGGRDRRV